MTGRRLLTYAGLVLVGIAGGLLAAEGMLRLFVAMPTLAENGIFYEPHPLYGWTHIPNQHGYWAGIVGPGIRSLRKEFRTKIQINSRGLRDREIPYEKPDGTTRILVLGDSMTEGMQVALEKTFPKRLEVILNAAGKRVEVVNAGTGMYGTDQELLFYRHEGRKYHPDLVLLAFFLNDPLDNFPPLSAASGRPGKPFFTLAPTGLVLENFPMPIAPKSSTSVMRSDWLEPVKGFLRKHSELYTFGSTIVLRSPFIVRTLSFLGLAKTEAIAHADATIQGIIQVPVFYLPFQVPEDPRLPQAWAVTKAIIRTLRQEVESDGHRFAVAILNASEQVHPDLWRLAQQRFPALLQGEWDLEKPNRILHGFLEEEHIAYVDLVPPLRARAAAGGEHLHFPFDGHYTVAGHAAVAEVLSAFIESNGLLAREERRRGTRAARP